MALLARRRWADRLLVLVMLLMVFSNGTALVDRFAESRAAVVAMYRSRQRPGRTLAGFLKTINRHSQRLLALLTQVLRGHMRQRLISHWHVGGAGGVGGFAAFGFDGTRIDCPRTKANERHFKIGGRRKSGPQMVLGVLIHLGTGLVWSWRRGDACTSERTLLRDVLVDLPEKSLVVTDAGFMGYDLLTEILAGGHRVLMRVGANVALLKKLGYAVEERNDTVYLWTQRAREKGLPPLILRRIVLVDGRNRRMCLLTDLPAEALSMAQARAVYARRWGVELLYRAMKQTLGRRKMLCDSPLHAEMELDWSVLGFWMLGLMLVETRRDKGPAYEGFAAILRIVRGAIVGRPPRHARGRLLGELWAIRRDRYRRRHGKSARNWPHKKNEPPCGAPLLRMATAREIRVAKGLLPLKRAA
jgi:hypothetical protein